jgi:hypothetical protein
MLLFEDIVLSSGGWKQCVPPKCLWQHIGLREVNQGTIYVYKYISY